MDFTNKAFESLDIIGWEHAPAILPSVVDQMVSARGSEKSMPGGRIDLVPLCEAAFAELPELLGDGSAKREVGETTRCWRGGCWAMTRQQSWRLSSQQFATVLTATDLSRATAYAS